MTKLPVVKTEWNEVVEYDFVVTCPNKSCRHWSWSYEFDCGDGNKVNKMVKCSKCKTKFRLQVPEYGS